jgi:predicted transcriptional regulator
MRNFEIGSGKCISEEALSDQNRTLLKMIAEIQPDSLTGLADAAGRKPGNLSGTLKTIEHYEFVGPKRTKQSLKCVAKAIEFRIHAAHKMNKV